MRCAIFNCNSDNQSKCFNKDIMFFRFPRDKSTCEKWVVACGRSDKFKVQNSHICSLHFLPTDYARDLKAELLNLPVYKNKRLLKDCSVPSLNLPSKKSIAAEPTNAGVEGRNQWAIQRTHRQLIETITQTHTQTPSDQAECNIDEVGGGCCNVREISRTVTIGVNTDESLPSIKALQNKISLLETEKAAVAKLFSPRHLQKLTRGSRRLKWAAEDIAKAIVLYETGPKGYQLLLKIGYPYPTVSTLKAWKKKFQILPGRKA